MQLETKKALFVFGGGFLLFYLLRPLVFKEGLATAQKPITDQQRSDALTAINGYKAAVDAGESTDRLQEVNQYAQQQYGLKVDRKIDGTYFAVTLDGQPIYI